MFINLKDESLENIINNIETQVTIYRNIDTEFFDIFTIVINFEFDYFVINRELLITLFYDVKLNRQLIIKDINEYETIFKIVIFIFYLRNN